jgi:site-specific recombinase XerD
MKTKLSIHFIGKKSRVNSHQLLPIYLRVTIDKKRFEVTTNINVKPHLWTPSAGRLKGRSQEVQEINNELESIKRLVYRYEENILAENREVTVATLRGKWLGEDNSKRTLLNVFSNAITEFKLLVEKGSYKKSTIIKYQTTERHLKSFLKWKNDSQDILLNDIRIGFAKNFQFYLETEKSMGINSSGKMLKNLKKVITDCVNREWLDHNPLLNYKVRHIDPKIQCLSAEELELIERKSISVERIACVRDMFLFSCYTGFAYIDAATLTKEHLKVGQDGRQWLVKPRQKTGITERVPLFPKALHILEKYQDHPTTKKTGKLLPLASNQKTNAYLKEMADICGITTHITFHIARHTFASTVTLENGVPIDTVSKMLGHRSIKTTQIYAKVSDRKISQDTEVLFEKFRTSI